MQSTVEVMLLMYPETCHQAARVFAATNGQGRNASNAQPSTTSPRDVSRATRTGPSISPTTHSADDIATARQIAATMPERSPV